MTNRYLEKIAEFTQDSYSEDLGYQHPGVASALLGTVMALQGAGMGAEAGPAGAAIGAGLGGLAGAGLGALIQNQANRKIENVLSAQENVIRSGKTQDLSPIYDQIKHDVGENQLSGSIGMGALGGMTGTLLGGLAGGYGGAVTGGLAGLGLGAAGGYALGGYGARKNNERIDKALAAREAYLRAKGL